MQLSDTLQVLTCVSALALAVTVGRTNIKRQTIKDLQTSNSALKLRVEILESENTKLKNQVTELEETIDGYSELVRQGHVAGLHGASSGDGTAHPQGTKNRSSR